MCSSDLTVLRPVEGDFTMILSSVVLLKRDSSNVDDFPYWAYPLTAFADLPSADETPERLVGIFADLFVILKLWMCDAEESS